MESSFQTGVARPEGAREAVRTPAAPTPREAVHRIPPRPDAPVITDVAGAPVAVASAQVSDEQLRMILDVSRLLAVPTDLDPLLCRIAEIACQLLNCERASIFLHDIVTGELWTKVAILSNEIRVQSKLGIVGHAFTQNCVVHVPEPYKDKRFNPEPDRRTGFVTRNLLTAPMAGVDGKPLGVIQAVNKNAAKGSQKDSPARAPFGENDVALIQLLAEQAGVAIQRHRLQLQAMEIVALRHEMDLARKTQQALIPKEPPGVQGIDAVGWTMPASTTGGDCFDLWRLPDGRLGILVADASGHGLGPALIVSQARTLIRALSDIETDPHAILARVNARLSDDLEWGQFVTAFLGFLSPDGELRWSSAGHGPIFFRTRAGVPMASVDPPVQPLGVIPRWMDDAPPPVRLEPTGSLMLVSDGIFEATNVAHDQMGIERMCQTLDDHQHKPPTEVLAALREAVRRWHGKQDPLDDQTIVIVQREGSAQRVAREAEAPGGGQVPAGT
jgi:phosphoserine phosphatase RsbU/P